MFLSLYAYIICCTYMSYIEPYNIIVRNLRYPASRRRPVRLMRVDAGGEKTKRKRTKKKLKDITFPRHRDVVDNSTHIFLRARRLVGRESDVFAHPYFVYTMTTLVSGSDFLSARLIRCGLHMKIYTRTYERIRVRRIYYVYAR